MGLVKCPDCGTEVSTNAVTCPKCGRVMASAAGSSITAESAYTLSLFHLIVGAIITFFSICQYDWGSVRFYAAGFGGFLATFGILGSIGRKRWAYLTLGIMDITVFVGLLGAVVW